ncbi:MAG: DUF502 domain-containing protein [Chlamydiia bacterium]|nr:DUF502 domain-containing protein [Chlamydiia bacterium]
MKKNFFSGLIFLLPLIVTLYLSSFLLDFLTAPFMGLIHWAVASINGSFALEFSGRSLALILLVSRVIALFFFVLVVMIIGFLTRSYFVRVLIQSGNWIFHRLPFVNKIYRATQDVTHTLLHQEESHFSQVVMVPFPNSKGRSLGFITHKSSNPSKGTKTSGLVSVFIPAIPNPTVGFLLLYREDQLIRLDMDVEQAFKCILSCGVILPKNFKQL